MNLLDYIEAAKARDEAIHRVDEHAAPDWKVAAYEAVVQTATELQQFTADDVFDRLNTEATTHDRRALGPVVIRAARARLIEKANVAPRLSSRRSRHCAPMTVWNSRICGETA
jgi:hypothetical protein